MNKSEFVSLIAEQGSITRAEAEIYLNNVTDSIIEAMKRREAVTLLGFGSFSVANRAARPGVNPKTLEKLDIPAYNAISFKAGSKMKEACNSNASKKDTSKTKSKSASKARAKFNIKSSTEDNDSAKAEIKAMEKSNKK